MPSSIQARQSWMEEGILDLNIAMNYKREFCVVGNEAPACFGFPQRAWYEHWNEFITDHQNDRQAVIGSALYLNSIPDSVAQIRKALAPSAAGNRSQGWVGYSFANPDSLATANQRPRDTSRAELTRALTQPSEYDPVTPPVFADPTLVPEMTWKTQPIAGHVMGTVATAAGVPFDQVSLELRDAETDALLAERLADGSGWFGFVDLEPGRYKVLVDGARVTGRRVAVFTVRAGGVTTVQITPRAR